MNKPRIRILFTLTLMLVIITAKAQSCPDENHPHSIDLGLPSGTMWAYPVCKKCYPIFSYQGISHEVVVMDDDNQIDSLLSKYLTDHLPLNVYDNCMFRVRIKLSIDKTGQGKIVKVYSDTPKELVRQIQSLLEMAKFQPATNKSKPCSFTANVMLLLDFTKPRE